MSRGKETTAGESEIRELLPRTWHAFFGRFGRLTGIQRHAVPPIAAGKFVLVNAPTASGKSEAMVAPVAERVLTARSASAPRALSVVIVAPTRALVNDLERRLHGPLAQIGLRLDIKTGDSPEFSEADPPDVLLTTPESLDSIEARHPAALRDVSAVLLDEVQLLRGTARGDQLRCLLCRLDRIARQPPQRCAATATVADVQALVHEFLGPAGICVQAQGPSGFQRPVDARLAPAMTLGQAAAAVAGLFHEAPGRKLLVFANTRAEVEMLAALLGSLPRLRSRVYAHHGSLARGERLRVEHQFKGAPTAICVATMTLELGIDIGDVDRVVLIAPPPDVASLLQRVGRSNRRESVTRVLGLYSGELERLRFEHLLECAAMGRLFNDPVLFRPTVIAQQALGLLMQSPTRWVSAEVIHERLPVDTNWVWTVSDCRAVLRSLAEAGHVREASRGRFVADVASEPLFQRGRIHSMIEDVRETEVVDSLTGQPVGSVRFRKADRESVRSGEKVSLALGGRKREVSHFRDEKIFVKSADGADSARFISREAPRYSAGLATDFARFLGAAPNEMCIERLEGGAWRLSHFLGTVWGHLLGWFLSATGHPTRNVGPLFLWLDRPLAHDALQSIDEDECTHLAAALLEGRRKNLAWMLAAGPFSDLIPEGMMDRWLRGSIDVEGFAARVRSTRIVERRLMAEEG